VKRIRAEGFLVFDFAERYGEGLKQLGQWIRDGKLKYFERVAEGLENAPQAFIEMLQGKNVGKQIVKLSEE
jgi:NADPH-dependent curcumin reductase CurA